MLSLNYPEPNDVTQNGVRQMEAPNAREPEPCSAFLFRLETQQEHAMPYLFWAVLPFALMDTWWGMCEQHRDAE